VSVAFGSVSGGPVFEAAMGWGRAAAGPTGNMGLAARAFFAASKAAPADDEVDGEDDDGGAGAVMLGETAGRTPVSLPGPVPASTDQTKMTNPHRIATARMSNPVRTTQPLVLAERIRMLGMVHTAPKPVRNAYRPT
jgi:hypothetical protein